MVMPSTVTAVQSNTITLICQVFGIPTPTVQWTSSSSNVALATNGTFTITTITNGNNVTSNLTISPVVKNDTATYTCTGSNGQINLIDSPENASSQVEIQGCYNFKSIFNLICLLLQYPLILQHSLAHQLWVLKGNLLSCRFSLPKMTLLLALRTSDGNLSPLELMLI